jgi:hypothetical protein
MEPMLFKAEGDFLHAGYFESVGERRLAYWDSLICPSLHLGLAVGAFLAARWTR